MRVYIKKSALWVLNSEIGFSYVSIFRHRHLFTHFTRITCGIKNKRVGIITDTAI